MCDLSSWLRVGLVAGSVWLAAGVAADDWAKAEAKSVEERAKAEAKWIEEDGKVHAEAIEEGYWRARAGWLRAANSPRGGPLATRVGAGRRAFESYRATAS